MASASLCPQSFRASLRPVTRASLLALSGNPPAPPHSHMPLRSQPQAAALVTIASGLTHCHKSQPQSPSQFQLQSRAGLPCQHPHHRHHHHPHRRQCLASGTFPSSLTRFQTNQPTPTFEIRNPSTRFQQGNVPPRPRTGFVDASQHRPSFAPSSSAVSAPTSEGQAGSAADSAAESATRPNFLQVLRERGFVESVTSEELKQGELSLWIKAPNSCHCALYRAPIHVTVHCTRNPFTSLNTCLCISL